MLGVCRRIVSVRASGELGELRVLLPASTTTSSQAVQWTLLDRDLTNVPSATTTRLSTQSKFVSAVGMLGSSPSSRHPPQTLASFGAAIPGAISRRDMRYSAAREAGCLGNSVPGGLMLGDSMLVRVWGQFCCTLKYFLGDLDDIFYGIFREIFPSTEGAKYFIKYFANPFAVW